MPLKWSDISWDRNRVRITSPKTEHISGKAERIVPLWPELKKELLELFEQAEEGEEHVITRYRGSRTNLRTQAHRIIRRAGLIPWPKLFHNMRSSRQTELSMDYPIHQVCAWIGNSQAVALNHYLQVRDEDINAAVEKASRSTPESATRKTTTQPLAVFGNQKQRNGTEIAEDVAQRPKFAELIARIRQFSDPEQKPKTGPRGLEETKSINSINTHHQHNNVKTDYFEKTGDSEAIDLNKEVESLPPELQAAVLGILMSNHRKRG